VRALFDWLWDVQERFLLWLWRLEDVGPAPQGAFRVRPTIYRGEPIALDDGTTVAPGHRIGELHLRNDTLASLHQQAQAPRQVGWLFRDLLVRGLRDLADLAAKGERYRDLPAFCSVTMLHYGAEKLGFEVRPLRAGLRLCLLRVYQRLLTARHHPSGAERIGQGTRAREPAEVWISRTSLLTLYGPSSQHLAEKHEPEAGLAQPPDDGGQCG
jgi:hypothetical protein